MGNIKKIYQVWFQGKENIENELFLENIKNWEMLNPDWEYNLLSEKELEKECQKFSDKALTAYLNSKTMHTKIDLGKLCTIYNNGGMMIDMDMYILRSLNTSKKINKIVLDYNLTCKSFIVLSEFHLSFLASYLAYGSFKSYNNAFIFSNKGNPVVKRIIETYCENILKYRNSNFLLNSIYIEKTTGPYQFNKIIQKVLKEDKDNIISLDYTIFEPCDLANVCDISDNTISIHQFSSSWIPKNVKKSASFFVYYKKDILIGILFIILFISFLFYIKLKKQ